MPFIKSKFSQEYFGVNPNNGNVFVKSELDRETAEIILLQILVEDIKAQEHPQTATGCYFCY